MRVVWTRDKAESVYGQLYTIRQWGFVQKTPNLNKLLFFSSLSAEAVFDFLHALSRQVIKGEM